MPRFSIVIPTYNRQFTLDYTLQTCLSLNYDDYEIIVHDGASDPPITVPEGVKLYRTDDNRSMCTDWNSALSYATGDYIILFGCDDGILPHALADLHSIIEALNNPPLVRYRRCYYTWKDDFFGPQHSGELQISKDGSSYMLNSKRLIAAVAQIKMDYTFLPMLYTAAIRRDLLDTLIERTGKVIDAIAPDIYSGFALASLVDNVPSINKPMTINAGSRWSTGVAHMMNPIEEGDAVRKHFQETNEKDGLFSDKRLPVDAHRTMGGALKDSFYSACKNGLLKESDLNTPYPNVPHFDGRIEGVYADDVFQASQIAGDALRDEPYSLDFKQW